MAVKSPFRSDYYERLISHLSVGLRTDPVSPNNRKDKSIFFYFFRGVLYLSYYFVRIIKIKLLFKDFRKRKRSLRAMDYIIVSYFPLIDKGKAEKNIFENRYIAPFHRILNERHRDNYAHICLQSTIDGYSMKDATRMANRFNRSQTIFFLEEFVRFSHVFLFVFYYFYFMLLFLLNIRVIKNKAIYTYKGKSYNTWQILKKDFYDSFCGENLVTSVWFILLFRELTKLIKQDSKVISICEMQWWERALYIFAKKRGITTIGFQHCIVPELVLNYFNSTEEINGNSSIEKCPLPDYLATVGEVTSKLFIKYGWPKERIFVWGAQRFEHLKDKRNFSVAWKDKKNYFVCALSIDEREMPEILSMLEFAFKGPLGYKIILKNHPAGMNLEKMLSKLNLDLNLNNFEISNDSLDNLLKWTKGLIVTESSASLYAVGCNIPVLVPRFMGRLDCNPLSYISDIPTYIYSPQELKGICDKIINSGNPAFISDKWGLFLKNYLYFPENEYEYLEKIDSLKNITF